MIDFNTEAWRVFDRWLSEHHPEDSAEDADGEFFGIFEAIEEFNSWAAKNSVEKYLDRNQSRSSHIHDDRTGTPSSIDNGSAL